MVGGCHADGGAAFACRDLRGLGWSCMRWGSRYFHGRAGGHLTRRSRLGTDRGVGKGMQILNEIPFFFATRRRFSLKGNAALYRVSQTRLLHVYLASLTASLTAFLVLRGVSPLPRATAFDVFGAGLAIACFLNSSCYRKKCINKR